MSIAQRRGIETIDLNLNFVFVRAPIHLVSPALARAKQADVCDRNVFNKEVEIVGESYLVFQFRSHPWTTIHRVYYMPHRTPLGEWHAETLSRLLNTRAFHYRASDTSGEIDYKVYENGNLIESLYFEEEMTFEFQSQISPLKAEEIENPYSYTYHFMREQDVYIPGLHDQTDIRIGQRSILKLINPTLEDLVAEDLEGFDYIGIR